MKASFFTAFLKFPFSSKSKWFPVRLISDFSTALGFACCVQIKPLRFCTVLYLDMDDQENSSKVQVLLHFIKIWVDAVFKG